MTEEQFQQLDRYDKERCLLERLGNIIARIIIERLPEDHPNRNDTGCKAATKIRRQFIRDIQGEFPWIIELKEPDATS